MIESGYFYTNLQIGSDIALISEVNTYTHMRNKFKNYKYERNKM